MTEQCYACVNPDAVVADVKKSDNLPLCQKHWNGWLTRFLGDDEAPCGAHLIVTDESVLTAMDRATARGGTR